MKYFDWNEKKNIQLKEERNISFEDMVIAIDEGSLLDILKHQSKDRYPDQKIFVIEMHGYAYLVPFVEDNKKIFLKTIIPSRKATEQYIIKHKKK